MYPQCRGYTRKQTLHRGECCSGEDLPENKRCIEANVVAAKILERHIVAATHRIEFLLHHAQRFTFQAFEADQESLATATRYQVKKLLVMCGIDTGL
jgi:hypothetical protein